MKYERFEDLEVWKLSRELVKSIYNISDKDKFWGDYGLANQMQKSSVSIMSNIAEGFERGNNKEFVYFLNVAKGSCGELRSQLYVSLDLGYISEDDFHRNIEMSEKISKSISGFIKYLKSRNLKS